MSDKLVIQQRMKNAILTLQKNWISALYQKLESAISKFLRKRNKSTSLFASTYFLLASLVIFSPDVLKAQNTSGSEITVYSHTDVQSTAKVASDDVGNFVVVWMARNLDGDGRGIFAKRYDSNGNAIGAEFQVNATFADNQVNPSIAMDSDGDFVITWSSFAQDGSDYGIFAQRYNASAVPQGSEFQVNTTTTSVQDFSSVAMDDLGNFIIVWHSLHPGDFDIFAQRYDKIGQALGSEFQVNNTTSNIQSDPFIAMDADGDFVVTWYSSSDVYARIFSSNGNSTTLDFRVNTYTDMEQHYPSAGMDALGNFVIVWQSEEQDGDLNGIYGQRFDASGNTVGSEFGINDVTAETQSNASVSMDAYGDFAVAWISEGQDGSGKTIMAKEFSSAGVQSGPEFIVNTTTFNDQLFPAVATRAHGDFVIVWNTFANIYAQRYTSLHQSLDDKFSSLNFGLFPNPASSLVQIDLSGSFTYRLKDLTGRVLIEEKTSNAAVSVENLESGIYSIEVIQGDSRGVSKLVVE